MNACLNLLAIGATGVGKSTFLNYLLDKPHFRTGDGLPVTGPGLYEKQTAVRGIPVRLFDTAGFEAGASDVWLKFLHAEMNRRGVAAEIADWFHGVCYLISATGNRVQKFDLDAVRLLVDAGYGVIVVLTKASKVSEDVIEAMSRVIREEMGDGVPVIAVNSVRETLRDGHVVEAWGRHEIEKEIVVRFWDTIKARVPQRVSHLLIRTVETRWDRQVVGSYLCPSNNKMFLDPDTVIASLKSRANGLIEEIANESVRICEEEVRVARATFSALAECMDIESQWAIADLDRTLQVAINLCVEAPASFRKILHRVSFGKIDATTKQRAAIRHAAEAFSDDLKRQIRDNLIPKIETSVRSIQLDVSRLQIRKRLSWWRRLVSRLRSRR